MIGAFFGRRGKGKSTLAFHQAKRLDVGGVLVFDPNAQFANGPVVETVEALAAVVNDDESPAILRPDHVKEDFARFSDFIWLMFQEGDPANRGVAVIVDEASLLQSPQGIHDWLSKLIRMGRGRGIALLQTMHRPQDANGITLSLASDLFFFHTTKALDLDRIERETNPGVRAAVERLRGFEYLHYSIEADAHIVHRDAASWFHELKPTKEVYA